MPDDFTTTPAGAGSVSVGGNAVGTIEEQFDQDWFRVSFVAGHAYELSLEGQPTSAGTLSDPYIRGIYDSSETLLPNSSNDDSGEGLNSFLRFIAPSTGTYYISAGAFSSHTGTYRLSVVDTGIADDYAAATSTTGHVDVDGRTTGIIERSGDSDWFAVDLTVGHNYRIDILGAPTSDGTLGDTYLNGIRDADGQLIAGTADDDDGTGLNSLLEFTPTQTGRYFIDAGAYGSGIGSYAVEVTDLGPSDDYADNTETTGTVAVGGTSSGVIEQAGDQDWFSTDLTAGHRYRVEVLGSPTSSGTLADTYLRGVHDAAGNLVPGTVDDDNGTGTNSLTEFVAGSTGEFFVAAGGYGSATGSYQVRVTDLGPVDDFAANTTTTGNLPTSASREGSIEVSGDQDWFAMNLIAGHTYVIDLQGAPTSAGTLTDPFLRGVFNAAGVEISGHQNDDGGVGLNSQVEFTATTTGRHYVSAGGFGTATGTYSISLTDMGGADDFAASTATTGALAINNSVFGNIETAGDQDWFRVNLVAGQTYTIDLLGNDGQGGSLSDPFLRGIYTSSGQLIPNTADDDSGAGRDSSLEFTATTSGIHYISAGAFSTNTGTYRLEITQETTAADDFLATTATTGAVSVGGSRTGVIETAGDQDWFRVTLAAGQSYQIDLEGAPTSAGSLSDPFLAGVYNAAGTLINGTSNDDSGVGLNSQITFVAPTAGTYFIGARSFGSGTGSYKVSVNSLGVADDFAATTGTTGAVAVGGAVSGDIEVSGDQDWFRVTLAAGQSYTLALEGTATNNGTLSDPYLRGVYNASGTLISGSTDDDSGTGLNSLLTFTAPTAGTYFIAAGAAGANTGTYKLSVVQNAPVGPTDDFAATTATGGTLAPGAPRTGNIESFGDEDWFRITLTAGQTYQFDLQGAPSGGGTLSDPYLRGIYNSTGQLIPGTTDDDSGTGANSRVTFVAATTGTYFVSAGAYQNGTGTYSLTVTQSTSTPTAPPTGGSGFDIQVVYTGDPAFQHYFDEAAALWESVITGDLSNVNHASLGLIDDLRIDASVVAIDGPGSILGQAGPRGFRSDNGLPYLGMMQFDSADLASMEARGILGAVIAHEMGHVLGIGTVWSTLGLKTGFNYTGVNALREYVTLLGSAASFVPLETGGGGGTAGSHWLESLFDTELMTGYAESSPPMPLSRLTIGSLQDMGYTVNYAAAQAYTLPSRPILAGLSAMAAPEAEPVAAVTDGPVLPALVDDHGFTGLRVTLYESKPQIITPGGEAIKLDGPVSSASETSVFFFETTTGDGYLIELVGDFEKDNPATAGGVKGTLTALRVHGGLGVVEEYDFSDSPVDVETALDNWRGTSTPGNILIEIATAEPQNDQITTGDGNDVLAGAAGNDVLISSGGADVLYGGDGADTLNAGTGDDFVYGGTTNADLRDVIFGGDGNDNLDGGAGNDEVNGGNGNDTVIGGLGSDTVVGNDGNDLLAGTGGSDLMFGNNGNDTLNGGFGYDRMNGGEGADSFFHLGVADHGSDWVQDYNAAQGDVLTFGNAAATASQFQVNFANTPGAGAAGVAEAFVIYRPTGQIIWALVDGAGQSSINIQIGGQVFDLI